MAARPTLDFCPYDFKKYNIDNLAYELVFPNGWSWERMKRVLGPDKLPFVNENDQLRAKHFGTDNVTRQVFLKESTVVGGKNGLQLFLEYLSQKKNQDGTLATGSSIITDAGDISKATSAGGYNDFGMSAQTPSIAVNGVEHTVDSLQDGPTQIRPRVREYDDAVEFVDEHDDVIMSALPCCPWCHNRIPVGWFDADDFCAVSLMAPTSGGKSTFLYSMMYDNWRAFRNLGSYNGKNLRVVSAHRVNDESDSVYYAMVKAANALCGKEKKCPSNTQKGYWIPPVFLKVQYGEKNYMVGLYDNAGENLENPDISHNPNLEMLLNKMYADIFLFDPTHMNLGIRPVSKANAEANLDLCQVLPLGEQGRMQRQKQGEYISAKEVLYPGQKDTDAKVVDILGVYHANLGLRTAYNFTDRMEKDMRFYGVLIKSDLLESYAGIGDNQRYQVLFDRSHLEDLTDPDSIYARSNMVQDMINQFHLLGQHKDLADFERDYGRNSVKWHCVSALGCNAVIAGEVLGEYSPIRVAEPLVACILDFIDDHE